MHAAVLGFTYGQPLQNCQLDSCQDQKGTQEAYLSIIDLARTEKRIKGIISWNKESCKVHEEFAGDVEEDQEKVDSDEAEESVDLRYGCLLFKVVEHRILGEL